MTDEQKLQILEDYVNQYNLSIYFGPFRDFLNAYRRKYVLTKDESQTLTFSSNVAPTLKTILPKDIVNASYAMDFDLSSLYDWLLYRNFEDNPFVFEHLDTDPQSLIYSFVEDKIKRGPVHASTDGRLFNGNDGNHRLLTLIIKYFAERHNAISQESKEEVDKKYQMTVPVSYPISQELSDALNDLKSEIDYSPFDDKLIPQKARTYRYNAMANSKQAEYLASYNPATNEYKLTFNDEVFVGTEDKLLKYLKQRQATRPIMYFNDGETYYVSIHNNIWFTKDKALSIAMLQEAKEMWDKQQLTPDSIITTIDFDMNDNQFGIEYDEKILSQNPTPQADEVAQQVLELLNEKEASFIDGETLEKIKQNCKRAKNFQMLSIPGFKVDMLTLDEYRQFRPFLDKLDNLFDIEIEKIDENEID